MICHWCRKPLFWVNGKGWVHSDGNKVITLRDPSGIVSGGHIASPIPDDDVVRPVHLPSIRLKP